MKKGNVIDLNRYRNQRSEKKQFMSEELKSAIQNLIDRLREEGPIKPSK